MLIKIVNTPTNCCGVICLGFQARVKERITLEDGEVIYILENGALVWANDTVPVEEMH